MPGPILEVGDDLVLRTVEREDAAFLQRLFTDPHARLGFHERSHKNENEVEELIEEQIEDDSNAAYVACVDEADAPWEHPEEDDTTPVAFVYAGHVDRDRPNLVLWVPPEHRGDGHAKAALELSLEGLFRTYDAHSVGASVLEGDDTTREAFDAVGFTDEGRGRELVFVDGEYRDLLQFGLLREEWEDD
ncbi:GNAT family N-acetyltransferase [Halobacterium wangiae]|uniref:GNAT family N-acetyltransferase n=1 Tax=Halobacterium wangiae TaxID=2902623 RepID=UPI001E3BE735|nr:GNAT family protein [Halobacterium wangiae]